MLFTRRVLPALVLALTLAGSIGGGIASAGTQPGVAAVIGFGGHEVTTEKPEMSICIMAPPQLTVSDYVVEVAVRDCRDQKLVCNLQCTHAMEGAADLDTARKIYSQCTRNCMTGAGCLAHPGDFEP